MFQRTIPVFVLLALLGPSLMAECLKCKIRPEPPVDPPQCVTAIIPTNGYQWCFENFETNECELGPRCTATLSAATPALASEYAVASVERLDERLPSPTLVASLP